MSTVNRIIALANAIGLDIKTLTNKQGDLTSLTTTAKGNLVAAINELKTLIGSGGGGGGVEIDDTAGAGDTDVAYSADKIVAVIALAKTQIQESILGGASEAYDTLKELQDLLENDQTALTALTSAVANRIRYDAEQTLTTPQKLQACTNLGIGDPETDLLAAYTAAKV